MSIVRKTKAGWIREITNMVNGALEQGGACGRQELYKRATLVAHGISYDADPNGRDICEHATNIEWLADMVGCDKVLKSGHTIR